MIPTFHQSPRDPAFVQNPYPTYARMRSLAPLFHWADYGMPATAAFDLMETILKDRRFGREVPEAERRARPPHLAPFYRIDDNSMLEREPPAHTRLRGLVLRAFTSRRIAGLAPEIRTLAHHLIDRFEGPHIDLLPTYAEQLPVIVIARLLGVPETSAPDLLNWSHAMVAMYQSRRDAQVEREALSATAEFSAFLADHIAARRRAPRDDLISHLIAARDAGDSLTEEELVATCILLLNAGHEATVHTIGNGAHFLLRTGRRPEDPVAMTEEVLAADPPLHVFQRIAMETVEIAGHRFEPGDRVALVLGASGGHAGEFLSDPVAIPKPYQTHTESIHLAFGLGRHFCLGAPLARMEVAIALPVLFERHPNLALASHPTYADRYHFRALKDLRVAL
ncbi:cytochrome P450 [Algicella marina]|uniref:Cytochrome P450 n=1 Tax=Algicella marina TaxID=2683284 RepID=A0A6P1SZ17_9RHOB|nr:cytochrome P450 [Algicella marina]QHQ34987.1 cytochrome P450 [Algicella marina]